MSLLRALARGYVLRRLLGGGGRGRRRRTGGYGSRGYGSRGYASRGPGSRGRGLVLAPQARRRSNVRVVGCCLPIPLGVLLASLVGAEGVRRRSRR